MNAIDYLLGDPNDRDGDFLLGNREVLTYPELIRETGRVAAHLHHAYGENNHILLVAPNSIFFLVAYLAIMKSGNICVPLNPSVEPQNLKIINVLCASRIAFVAHSLNDERWSNLEHVHTDLDFGGKDGTIAGQGVSSAPGSIEPVGENPGAFDPDRLAQIIFTSGSTGEPKGVMITHRNLIANTESIVDYLGLTRNDVVHIVLPFYYCYGLSLLHTHLKVGGKVVFNNNFMFLGSVLKDWKTYGCTGFAGVPSHFQILLRKSKSFATESFPSLRYVTQAGGKLHKAFIQEFTDSHPEITFYVMYGQTEATARLSYLPPERLKDKLGSLGKAIPGVTLELMDESGRLIEEAGKKGELVARGDNIMKGYIGDPESTAATLRDGWLHTGDIAYKDEDGFYFHTARQKEIIKVGGRRISPKEIEEVIVSIPGVVDCSISAIEDELLGEALKAEIVVADLQSEIVDEKIFKKLCAEKLAPEKVPQVVQFTNRFEVAPTGKKVKKLT